MNLIWAAWLVLTASSRNRLRRQIQRMRQPKYLVATALGGLYIWSIFIRRMAFLGPKAHAPEWSYPVIELLACGLAVFTVATTWVFGDDDGALRFTEAEIQFFFPAPVTRAGILRYKLVRTGVVALLSAAVMCLFIGARITPHTACFILGAWLAIFTLSLHSSASSMARATLADFGLRGLRRQLPTVVVLLAAGAALVHGVAQGGPVDWRDIDSAASLSTWAQWVLDTPPTKYVLFPVRVSLDVALAPSFGQALARSPAAFAVLGVHYLWLMRSHFSFEEASVEAAQKLATRMESFRAGRGLLTVRQIRPPFRLGPLGRTEVAILWKNLVGITRAYSLRGGLILGYFGLSTAAIAWATIRTRGDLRAAMVTLICAVLACYLVLLGPIVLRCDLRQDLAQVDQLRAWPLSGRQIVAGEVLAPAAVLMVGQWFLLGISAIAAPYVHFSLLGPSARLAILGAAALVFPAITLCTLVLQNGTALLFPAWVSPERRVRGIEAMGQRLLTLAANLLALVGAMLPAALLGAVVLLPGWWLLGWGGVPIAAAVAMAVLLAEAYLAIGWLGGVFERFDLTL